MCNSYRIWYLMVLFLCLTTGCVNSAENPALAKINVQLGLAYLDKKEIAQAKLKFLEAKQQAPKEPLVWYSMAYFFERTGDLKKAQSYYQTAISLSPQSGCAHNNYGTFLCRQGKYREAIEQFNLAVQDEYYLDAAGAYQNAWICALRIPDIPLAQYYLKLGGRSKT